MPFRSANYFSISCAMSLNAFLHAVNAFFSSKLISDSLWVYHLMPSKLGFHCIVANIAVWVWHFISSGFIGVRRGPPLSQLRLYGRVNHVLWTTIGGVYDLVEGKTQYKKYQRSDLPPPVSPISYKTTKSHKKTDQKQTTVSWKNRFQTDMI